jgi:hypothetical protein
MAVTSALKTGSASMVRVVPLVTAGRTRAIQVKRSGIQ